MKKYGLTMMAGLAALAIASTASAVTTNKFYITGSSAFRGAAHDGIVSAITPASLTYGWTGTKGLKGASQAEFRGFLVADGTTFVDIKTAWSGSIDGLQRIINHGNASFNRSDWLNSANLTAAGAANIAADFEAAGPADAAFSDGFQNSTIYQNPALNDVVVGVIPFVWVRNNGAPSTLANMTSSLAQQILTSGSLSLKLFTGNSADESSLVRVTGRNADSGTRLSAFADSGFGVGTPPQQYQVNVTGGAISSVVIYPAETVLGTFYPTGQSGYNSGSLVANALNATGSNSAPLPANQQGWIVSYLGVSDASTVNGGNNNLTYEGVPYSVANVQNGSYGFWGYEHFLTQTLSATKQTIANSITSTILTIDPSAYGGINLFTLTVGRYSDGGPISDGSAY